MPEQNKPFVVTDRRKHTLAGEPRPDADPSPEREARPEAATPSTTAGGPIAVPALEHPATAHSAAAPTTNPPSTDEIGRPEEHDPDLPPPLTEEQIHEAKFAYEATADRIDTAIRAANPGMEHPPAMSFDRLVQSVYMTAIMQLGGSAQEGEQPRIDLMGARQSIEMLAVLTEKTRDNLAEPEAMLLENALFELRMAFLEVTQALARSATAAQGQQPGAPGRPAPATPPRRPQHRPLVR